jgi:hypothetical protein
MRRTIVTSEINVIGKGWYNQNMAYTYNLSDYDISNMWNDEFTALEDAITREDVEEWLSKNAGDFQFIDDFEADISYGTEDLVIPWKEEESGMHWHSAMYGEED